MEVTDRKFTVTDMVETDGKFKVTDVVETDGKSAASMQRAQSKSKNMIFIDATDIMITADEDFRPELFRSDEIQQS